MDGLSSTPNLSPRPAVSVSGAKPSHRSVWLWVVIVVILLSLVAVAWQKGVFNQADKKNGLTPEEVAKVQEFLATYEAEPLSEAELKSINNYLNETPAEPLSAEEQAQIDAYLRGN